MVPDAIAVEAGKTFLDLGIAGAVIIVLIGFLGWTVKQWQNERKEYAKKLDEEKDARLADAKEFAMLGETTRNAIAANTTAIQAMLEAFKDRKRL